MQHQNRKMNNASLAISVDPLFKSSMLNRFYLAQARKAASNKKNKPSLQSLLKLFSPLAMLQELSLVDSYCTLQRLARHWSIPTQLFGKSMFHDCNHCNRKQNPLENLTHCSKDCLFLFLGRVVSFTSVVATGLVWRHRLKFDTLRAVCGLEAAAQAILGALESLQKHSPFKTFF